MTYEEIYEELAERFPAIPKHILMALLLQRNEYHEVKESASRAVEDGLVSRWL